MGAIGPSRNHVKRFSARRRGAISMALREFRIERGLTQCALGRRCNINDCTISNIEVGIRVDALKLVHLMAILKALGLTLSDFERRVDEILGEIDKEELAAKAVAFKRRLRIV